MRKQYPLKVNAASPLGFMSREDMEKIHSCALELLQDMDRRSSTRAPLKC